MIIDTPSKIKTESECVAELMKMYQELTETLSKLIEERDSQIQKVIATLKSEMTSICPNAVVYGRQKQLYSIAKKLQSKNMTVSMLALCDIIFITIITKGYLRQRKY